MRRQRDPYLWPPLESGTMDTYRGTPRCANIRGRGRNLIGGFDVSKRTTGEGPNPSGLCMCGCGFPTEMAKTSYAARGDVAGKPRRYINGHYQRAGRSRYIISSNGCWIWQLSLSTCGYGRQLIGRNKALSAHRVYWERKNGPVPDGLELDHLCRNRACVNPDHLEAVTHAENCRRGGRSKLTQEKADGIRRRYMAGETQLALAAEYGVSGQSVSDICCGKRWAS